MGLRSAVGTAPCSRPLQARRSARARAQEQCASGAAGRRWAEAQDGRATSLEMSPRQAAWLRHAATLASERAGMRSRRRGPSARLRHSAAAIRLRAVVRAGTQGAPARIPALFSPRGAGAVCVPRAVSPLPLCFSQTPKLRSLAGRPLRPAGHRRPALAGGVAAARDTLIPSAHQPSASPYFTRPAPAPASPLAPAVYAHSPLAVPPIAVMLSTPARAPAPGPRPAPEPVLRCLLQTGSDTPGPAPAGGPARPLWPDTLAALP